MSVRSARLAAGIEKSLDFNGTFWSCWNCIESSYNSFKSYEIFYFNIIATTSLESQKPENIKATRETTTQIPNMRDSLTFDVYQAPWEWNFPPASEFQGGYFMGRKIKNL